MNGLIDKSTYMEALNCIKNVWFKLNKPELRELFLSTEFEQGIIDQGKLVEELAQQLFPTGIFIESFDKHKAIIVTNHHIKLKTSVIFQPTFVWDSFLVRNDILEYDEQTGLWNLYEIKAKNLLKESTNEIDPIEDATFQFIVLKERGLNIGKISIIHLNKEYVRDSAINIDELFIVEDVTNKVSGREHATRLKMHAIQTELLKNDEQYLSCKCIYNGRSKHCPTFEYSHKDVPGYSVHDISRIGNSKKKLAQLIDMKAFSLDDIPDDFSLSEIQKNQVYSYRFQTPLINHQLIKDELDALSYPLYFLDYETYSSAIPMYKGFHPYQHLVFQFSLHVMADKNSELSHFEYLHELNTDSSLDIIKKLLEYIGPIGTIVVWNKSFEKGKNSEFADRHPDYKEFLDDINNRLYDLEDVFTKQMYVHPEFKGKTSIKNILPVLVPELNYKNLSINNGGLASQKWLDMNFKNLLAEERQDIANDLREYCKLDTYAMYKIWNFLTALSNRS